MPYTVLVPHDGSNASDQALAWAAQLVRATGGTLHLLRAVPFAAPPPMPTPAPLYNPTPMPEDLAAAREGLAEASTRAGVTPASAEVLVTEHVGEAIIRTARTLGATLIVMGTHGRGGLARAFLGSVADYAIRHADCPVMTFRGST